MPHIVVPVLTAIDPNKPGQMLRKPLGSSHVIRSARDQLPHNVVLVLGPRPGLYRIRERAVERLIFLIGLIEELL